MTTIVGVRSEVGVNLPVILRRVTLAHCEDAFGSVGVVVAHERTTDTTTTLRQDRSRVVTIAGSELDRGQGGPRLNELRPDPRSRVTREDPRWSTCSASPT